MAHITRRIARNLVDLPQSHVEFVAEVNERVGPRRAANELGIGRSGQLTVIAKHRASRGTASLVVEAMRRGGKIS